MLEVAWSDTLVIILENNMHPKLLLLKVSITSPKSINNASQNFESTSLGDC